MTPADLSTDSPAGAFAEGSPGPAAGFAPPRPVAGGRLFWPALGLALAAVFFVKMSDYDIFYHLAIGREIARLGGGALP